MTVTDVASRIAQIQSQLAMLVPAAGTTASSASFATALDAASGTTAEAPTGAVTGDSVVEEAKKYLGVPYVWGGEDPQKGLDCSGLVQLVFKNLGHDLPRLAGPQVLAGTPVASLSEAKPGDLLGFGSPMHHVGIYLGDNMMLNAPRPGKNVRIEAVYEKPTHIGRIIPDQAVASTVSAPAHGAAGLSSVQTASVPTTSPYADLFNRAGAKYGVSPALLSAVAKQESGYNPAAVSPVGARGLMQLMPGTAKGLGVTDAFDPAQAVEGAAKMLRNLINRFGQTDLALAAYNAGPGAVIKYDGIPPYRETQHYVRTVMDTLKAAS